MGTLWLHDLDDWMREEGIPFREYPGWLTRSRSSGGFDKLLGAVAHHTGSNSSWQNDCAYMWQNAATRPIGNVHLDRAGVFTLGAAGACNTNGRGIAPWHCSQGTIPIDPTTMGNRMALAVEAANNGVGERWPRVQMDSYLRFLNMLARRRGWDPIRDINTHRGWAGTRKSDPFGPAEGYPTLGSGTWPVPALRSLVAAAGPSEPPPPVEPTEGEADMFLLMRFGGDPIAGGWSGWCSASAGPAKRRGLTGAQWSSVIASGVAYDGKTLARVTDGNKVSWTSSSAELDKYLGTAI
jgi:N-acetylmuramoyl-L-alanine amidase